MRERRVALGVTAFPPKPFHALTLVLWITGSVESIQYVPAREWYQIMDTYLKTSVLHTYDALLVIIYMYSIHGMNIRRSRHNRLSHTPCPNDVGFSIRWGLIWSRIILVKWLIRALRSDIVH